MLQIDLSAHQGLMLLRLRLSGVPSVVALRQIGRPLVYSVPTGYLRHLRWHTTNVTLPYVSVLKSEAIEPVGFDPRPPIPRKRLRKHVSVGSTWEFKVSSKRRG